MREKTSAERLQHLARTQQRKSWRPTEDAVVLHFAYGAGSTCHLEGRVIDFQHNSMASVTDRKRVNLRRNLGLLLNDERAHVPVSITLRTHEWESVTDAEGYFCIESHSVAALSPGWHRLRVTAGDATDESSLLVIPPQNTHGVISDVDDTLLVTEVGSKRRLLINTLLNNPLQRRVVSGVAAVYEKLLSLNPVANAQPMFYLSATPRQLHVPLQAILEHNAMPRGVLITKRVTNDATSEPICDQFAYKTRKIEQIMARLPHVNFTLVGDDAERDPEIFQEIRRRHAQRVRNVYIRRVPGKPGRVTFDDQIDLRSVLPS